MQFNDPLALIGAVALIVFGWLLGRWWQRRLDPLVLEGRLLDEQLRLAKRIAALQTGETAEEIAERARQAKVRQDILSLDQHNAAG